MVKRCGISTSVYGNQIQRYYLGFLLLLLSTVFLENGTFDYMKVSAECYRRQITQSVESLHLSGMPSSSSNLTHVAFLKVLL